MKTVMPAAQSANFLILDWLVGSIERLICAYRMTVKLCREGWRKIRVEPQRRYHSELATDRRRQQCWVM
jgi:hypothetical protein